MVPNVGFLTLPLCKLVWRKSDELVVFRFPTGTLKLTSPDRIQQQANIIGIWRNQNGDHSQEHRVMAEGN